MSINLPHLSGAHLASMRAAFGLLQSDLVRDTGCSVSAIQKAEAGRDIHIGPTLARAIAPHLLGARDVMLELALTLPAVQAASAHGVKRWRTPVGDAWWLPQIRAWRQGLALKTSRSFGSIDSMARFLCSQIGVDEDEGVLLCEACEEAGVDEPNAAWRACAKCGKVLCGSEMCGRYVLSPFEGVQEGRPVMCRTCLRPVTARAMRRPDPLPGTDRVKQLEDIWSDLRTKCSEDDAYHNGFRLVVEDELEETNAQISAVRQAIRSWVGRPHHALQDAIADAETSRTSIAALHRRVVEFRR